MSVEGHGAEGGIYRFPGDPWEKPIPCWRIGLRPHIQPSCLPDRIYLCYLSSQVCASLLWQPLEKSYAFVLLWQPFKIKVGLVPIQNTASV